MPSDTNRAPQVIQDRILSVGVRHVALCPKMDLVALALDGATVVLQRLSWQRLATIPPPSPPGAASERGATAEITALAWAPNASALAIGAEDGLVRLVMIDAAVGAPQKVQPIHGAALSSPEVRLSHPVTALTWAEVPNNQPAAYDDRDQGQTDSGGIIAVGDSEGTVTLYSFHLSVTVASVQALSKGFSVLYIFFSPKVPLCCVAGSSSSSLKSDSAVAIDDKSKNDLKLACLNFESMWHVKAELFRTGAEIVALRDLLEQLRKLIEDCTKLWFIDAMGSVEETIAKPLRKLAYDFAEETDSGPWSLLYNAFCGGGISGALEQFLARSLGESGAKELLRSFSATSGQMLRALYHVLPIAERMVFRLSEFRGLTRVGKGFRDLGITTEDISRAFLAAERLLEHLSMFALEIEAADKEMKAFLRWTISAAVQIVGARPDVRDPSALQLSKDELVLATSFFQGVVVSRDGPRLESPVTSMFDEIKIVFNELSGATQAIVDVPNMYLSQELCRNHETELGKSITLHDVTASSEIILCEDSTQNNCIKWSLTNSPRHISTVQRIFDVIATKSVVGSVENWLWSHQEVCSLGSSIQAVCGQDEVLALLTRDEAVNDKAKFKLMLTEFPRVPTRYHVERYADALPERISKVVSSENTHRPEPASHVTLCTDSSNARCLLDIDVKRSLACALIGSRRVILIDLGLQKSDIAKVS